MKKKLLHIFSVVLLLIFSFGCEKPIPTEPKMFSLKMERKNCYGPCPVYNLGVQSDGKVLFEGMTVEAALDFLMRFPLSADIDFI